MQRATTATVGGGSRSAAAVAVAAALLAVALLLAACGGGSGSPGVANIKSTSTTGSSSGSRSAQALKFAVCMRSHGISNFPDPSPGTSTFPIVPGIEKTLGFASAEQACKKFLPTAPTSQGSSAAQAKQMQAGALAMARCLRAHGISNFPDPDISIGPGGGLRVTFGGPVSGINLSSPAFQAAQKACPKSLGGSLAIAMIYARQTSGAGG